MKKYLFNTEKLKYILDNEKFDGCILCEILKQNPTVESLELYRSNFSIVTINLYPFNPGHLLIFPMRHVECVEDLSDEEGCDIFKLTQKSVSILKSKYKPSGFNLGYNIGQDSGASISHLHKHIVPRYKNEVGFIDVLGGTKPIVIDPIEIMNYLKAEFKKS